MRMRIKHPALDMIVLRQSSLFPKRSELKDVRAKAAYSERLADRYCVREGRADAARGRDGKCSDAGA